MDLRSEHQNAWPGLLSLSFKAWPQRPDHNLSEPGDEQLTFVSLQDGLGIKRQRR